MCLYPLHKAKDIRNFLRDCEACPKQKNNVLLKKLVDEKSTTGPSKSKLVGIDRNKPTTETIEDRKVGRATTIRRQYYSRFEVTFSDDNQSYTSKGRGNDGPDKSIISSRIAKYAVLNGIGKLRNSPFVTLNADFGLI